MKAERAAALAILIVYAAATLYVGLHHEPWRDEADSWLVVRDASIPTILEWTRDAGTPALWYLLLKPLVWLGLPYLSQELLHLALAWAAAAVLLFASPFPWITRVLVLASYYFSYEYAVVARSYVLTVLLSFLAAAWYRKPIRFAIVVALLFNANVHGAILAAVFLLLFAIEQPRSRAAIAIMMAGAFAAWAQLRTAPDAAYPHIIRQVHPTDAWIAIGSALFAGLPLAIAGACAIAVVAIVACSLRRRRDALAFLALSLVLLEVLYVFVWFAGYRHAGLLLLCVILALWIARDVPRAAFVAIGLSCLVLAIFGVRMAAADVKMDFSGSREMGEFIAAHHLDRVEVAAHNFYACEAVLPYLPPKPVWYPALGRYGTYMHWNRDERVGVLMPNDVAVARAIGRFAPAGRPWLMLLNAPMPPPFASEFQLVYATHGFVFRHPDERYWLYAYQRPTR